MQRLREVFHWHRPERVAPLHQCRCLGSLTWWCLGWGRSGDAGVGEEHVEVPVLGVDAGGDVEEGGFGGHVADDGDDVGVGALGDCSLKGGFAPAWGG